MLQHRTVVRIGFLIAGLVALTACGDSVGPEPTDARLFRYASVGSEYTCGITVDNRLFCWGRNSAGQLGDGTTEDRYLPTRAGPSSPIDVVSTGRNHTCALTTEGVAWCWGWNYDGQLGLGIPLDTGQATADDQQRAQPAQVNTSLRFTMISAGSDHTCAIDTEAKAHCWGANPTGAVGAAATNSCVGTPCAISPLEVSGGLRFDQISAGTAHTCGLVRDGSVYCWGDNSDGQLGTTTSELCEAFGDSIPCSTAPLQVSGGVRWDELGAGWGHTCGLTVSGEMYCWGDNHDGQVGDGTDVSRASPALVSGGMQFVQTSVGYLHSCARAADGRGYCWGSNIYGEIGDGTRDRRTEPTLVQGDHTFTTITAGGGPCHGHTCGITTDGDTYCWGLNYQREINPYGVFVYVPAPLERDPGLDRIVIGGGAVCGLTAESELYCWGGGIYGQVGTGVSGSVAAPTAIRDELRFSSVSTGHDHTCAVTVDGATYCWGLNHKGQLGNGSNGLGWTVPVAVWQ